MRHDRRRGTTSHEAIYSIFNSAGEAKLTMALVTATVARRARLPISGIVATHLQERMHAMTIAVGDKLPDVKLMKAGEAGPEAVQSADYFKGRRVALFSVPGAFTPTCSAKHLPSYVQKAGELRAKGIDEIACTAVNDAFVMGAWGRADGSADVTMLGDGNGDLAQALGLTMDGSGFGLGQRGSRWSMVVNDGAVEQLNVEAPGEYKVSSAEHMLEQL